MSNELVEASLVSVPAINGKAMLPVMAERAGGQFHETNPAEHADAAGRDRGPVHGLGGAIPASCGKRENDNAFNETSRISK